MNKKSKSIVVLALLLVLGFLINYKVQYAEVNTKWKDAPVEIFQLGDKVAFGDDILMDFTMEGYSIRVNGAEIMEYQEFLEKYGGKDEYTYAPDRIYDVSITLWNDEADDGVGINLQDFYIQGTGTYASINVQMLELANPQLEGNTAIALRKNSNIEIHLPYNLNKNFFRKKIWENLENFEMKLVATLYPVKKVIEIV